jgi:AcrR family transcriptional regulator
VSHTFASRRVANRLRRNEARQQILDVARLELREKPFRDLSVDDLMRATGLSRTAFYRYFPDREAVLVDLLEEVWSTLAEARDADDSQLVSAGSLAHLADLLGDNRAVLKAIADAAPGDEDVERAYSEFMHSYWIDDLTARIIEAQEHGLAAGLDPQLAGEALGWMAERLVTQSLDRDPRQVLDTIISILVKCIYTGNSAEPSTPEVEQGPASGQPGSSQPGSSQPGSSQPRSSQPRSSQPRSSQPGSSQPGSSPPPGIVAKEPAGDTATSGGREGEPG